MKSNREEIVRALECCKGGGNACLDCIYFYKAVDTSCAPFLIKDALALIKELIEENETLRGLYEHNSQLAIDSERKLEQCKKGYEDELSRVHMLLSMAWESVESKDKLLGTIKEDTVQKMQERLKVKAEIVSTYGNPTMVDVDYINQIAKEMLEENNV